MTELADQYVESLNEILLQLEKKNSLSQLTEADELLAQFKLEIFNVPRKIKKSTS